jgi:hypothetical protein
VKETARHKGIKKGGGGGTAEINEERLGAAATAAEEGEGLCSKGGERTVEGFRRKKVKIK